MVPTLPPNTVVYCWQWFWRLRADDVIIFRHDYKELLKRIESIEHGRIFVLGDHAATSTDSRHFGTILRREVRGKVIWPRAPKLKLPD